MAGSLLVDAFAHHAWATLLLLDAAERLTREQLDRNHAGTPGSILQTLRHLVSSDAEYLRLLTSTPTPNVTPGGLALDELRALVLETNAGWSAFLSEHPDPDRMVLEVDPKDGFRRDAAIGVRLAQALHHGNDHRSQVSSALTALNVAPPDISAWAFGVASGRSTEMLP